MRSDDLKLSPHCSACHSFLQGNVERIITVWLVPHVVQYRGDDIRIIWRCSFGEICEAGCLYARTREKEKEWEG